VLERVHRAVLEGRVVERRDVPETEGDCPERERDERMREEARPLDPSEGQERAQQRSREAEHDEQRGKVADHDVLRHVDGEQPRLADRIERGDERERQRREPGEEAGGLHRRDVPAATP